MESSKKYRIGIDLGGTNIKTGILDENGTILLKSSTPTGAQREWQQVADDIIASVKNLMEQMNISFDDCVGIGMGCPGTIDSQNGIVVYSNNFNNWKNLPMVEYLRTALPLPIRISNDANCAALGECVAGAAKEYSSAVMITLGTGVGGGVVWDGKLFEGGPGGVELGHTVIETNGKPCSCGRKGCFEAYASANSLIRDAVAAAKAHPESSLNQLCDGNLDNMNGKIPFDAAQAGDPVAQEVINEYIRMLGEGITNMVNIFRPEVVLLSGGVCAQGENLTVPLNAYLNEHAYGAQYNPAPPVKIAQVGNDAGLIGAAFLVQQ